MTETTAASASPRTSDPLPIAVTALLKGVVYADDAARWHAVTSTQAQVRDYVAVLGLALYLDEAEGYAFLRSKADEDVETDLPRLIPRRSLTFHVSLMLALLRRRLAEFDATSTETRLVLSGDQLVEMVQVFRPASSNEARLQDQAAATISKVADLGFLRRLRGEDEQYEVMRILRAFVDAQWLGELDSLLARYRESMEDR